MDFIPYGKQLITQDDIHAVVNTLQSDYLTTGPKVKEFEDALASYTGAKYAVVMSNGTAALHLLSLVLLEKNDKVLTTPNSFVSTSNAILYAGARPIFIDIEPSGNIDLDACEKALQDDSSIKAIYAVAFSGHMVNQKKLAYLKEKYGVIIIEDCAHAIGANEDNIRAGSCRNSECSILSFHPVKHITTGEGGAVTTNSKELYEKILTLRTHGIIKTADMKPWEYEMQALGFNYRISDIQCALGLTQLKRLDENINRRIELAQKYDAAFKNSIIKPLYTYDKKSSYHLYVVLVDFNKLKITKEELFIRLREQKVGIQLHYIPINKQPYYKSIGYGKENTPVMDKYYSECFSLPMYASLTNDQHEYVITTLFEVLNV